MFPPQCVLVLPGPKGVLTKQFLPYDPEALTAWNAIWVYAILIGPDLISLNQSEWVNATSIHHGDWKGIGYSH